MEEFLSVDEMFRLQHYIVGDLVFVGIILDSKDKFFGRDALHPEVHCPLKPSTNSEPKLLNNRAGEEEVGEEEVASS